MKTKLVLIVALLFLSFGNGAIGQLNPCWKMYYPDEPWNGTRNPDSVMVDTCLSDTNYTLPWAYKVLYAKRWFRLSLPNFALSIPELPYDSLVFRNWRDIDTSFTNLRDGFANLESLFGAFTLLKESPNEINTSSLASRSYLLKFENYVHIDSVDTLLKELDDIEVSYYWGMCNKDLGIFNEPGLEMGNMNNDNYPPHIKHKIMNRLPDYHTRSNQWNLLSIHIPIAWEITKGSKNVVICVLDGNFLNHGQYYRFFKVRFIDKQGIEREEVRFHGAGYRVPGPNEVGWVKWNNEVFTNGYYFDNDIYINDEDAGISCSFTKAEINNLWKWNKGWELSHGIGKGLYQTEDQITRTGDFYLKVTQNRSTNPVEATQNGNIIYNEVFKNGEYIPDKGAGEHINKMVNYCHGSEILSIINPKLNEKGIVGVAPNCMAVAAFETLKPDLIDINPYISGIQSPHVASQSNLSVSTEVYNTAIIKGGMVFVTGHGIPFYELKEKNNVLYQSNSFNEDIQPINLGVLIDCFNERINSGSNCVPWDFRINLYDTYGNTASFWYECSEYFHDGGVDFYGTGHSTSHPYKYSYNDKLGRFAKSNLNLKDVVAPARAFSLLEGGGYGYNAGTLSYAIPHVTSIAALMRSVDLHLGNANAEGIVTIPANIHRKAYDIVTFTADKIPPKVGPDPILQNYQITDGMDYLSPVNNPDALKRWWSKTMGYGKVNAFRCLAHSIRNKGYQTYSTSGNLLFAEDDGTQSPYKSEGYFIDIGETDESGNVIRKKVMHFGAYNHSNQLVLQKGGNKYYIEPDYNNCHGSTYINGSNTTLTVPENCILAIDGILKQYQTPSNNKIRTTNNGKILVIGFLENVALEGMLKIDDLKVFTTSSNNPPFARLVADNLGNADNFSEIFGKVELNNESQLSVNSGTLIMRPGSYAQRRSF